MDAVVRSFPFGAKNKDILHLTVTESTTNNHILFGKVLRILCARSSLCTKHPTHLLLQAETRRTYFWRIAIISEQNAISNNAVEFLRWKAFSLMAWDNTIVNRISSEEFSIGWNLL